MVNWLDDLEIFIVLSTIFALMGCFINADRIYLFIRESFVIVGLTPPHSADQDSIDFLRAVLGISVAGLFFLFGL